MSIVLKDEAKLVDVQKLQKNIDASVYAKSTEYIDKERAAKELAEELGQDPTEFLGYNPLLGSIELKLNSDYANNDSIALIEAELHKYPLVKEVIYQKDLIEVINQNVNRISAFLMGLSILLIIVSYALISNTVRLTVYAKRFIIHTMKLVGATGSFIRRPFLAQGAITGLISSFIGMALLSGVLYLAQSELSDLFSMESIDALLISFVVMLIFGILITTISTFMSVGRYLRLQVDDMYYI
jgi:cell division transport system permease protein